MFAFTGSLKVYVAVQPADMRNSFNGLYALTRSVLREDPCNGALFVFTNRSRNRVKIQCRDGSRLSVLAKRLEKGTFAWPKASVRGASIVHRARGAFHAASRNRSGACQAAPVAQPLIFLQFPFYMHIL